MLNQKEKNILLKIARETLKKYFQGQKYFYPAKISPNLKKKSGAFVTLKKDNHLRGCLGYLNSDKPLYQTISELAQKSAFADSRFLPLKPAELEKIKIEISLLSPLQKIKTSKEIKLGRDGVIIEKGEKKGVFLPQVATENNWDLKTFLNYLCVEKAGLPQGSWQDKKANLYTFQVEVWTE